jgi:hypothetical protein
MDTDTDMDAYPDMLVAVQYIIYWTATGSAPL